MIKNNFTDIRPEVPLFAAFKALQLITEQDHITGTNRWRHDTGDDSLAAIDPQLVELVQKQPPTKFGKAEQPSLWFAVHFFLALPALSYAFKMYGTEDPVTSQVRLNREELSKYFPAFPYLAKHYFEYHEFIRNFSAPSDEIWQDLLQTPLEGVTPGVSVEQALARLPQYLQEKAEQVYNGQKDSLVGRIVLAYLLELGYKPEAVNFDKRTVQYVKPMHSSVLEQSLYHRLTAAQAEMGQLEPFLGNYETEQSLKLNDFFSLITWFGRPHMVEMVIPGLAGAAEPVVHALQLLFADMLEQGAPDYTAAPLEALPSVQKFYATQSLEAIGRLSIVKDILNVDEIVTDPDGVALRKLAAHLYTEDERIQAWGNPKYYVPDSRRTSGFAAFRQDIVDIIYSAALFMDDKNAEGVVDTVALKRLATRLLHGNTMDDMRSIVHSQRRSIRDLYENWEKRYPGHERVRLIRFVLQTFGLEAVKPTPISLGEINKGFAKSHLEGTLYHLHYQEADEQFELTIPVSPENTDLPTVYYQTCKSHESPRISPAGIPYSAWLEVVPVGSTSPLILPVPGRGSFDPFGRAGSAHAGEVIGFGCSVQHASLAIILAELASLGASRSDLERVTQAFMHINKDIHERHDLAAFQLAQTLAAFEKGEAYTIQNYLHEHPDTAADTKRPQLAAYLHTKDTSLAWAEPQAAWLCFGYPELYPHHDDASLTARHSWYDGKRVELPEAEVTWHTLNR